MTLFREINAGGTTVLVATHDRELIRLVALHSSRWITEALWRWREGSGLFAASGVGQPVVRRARRRPLRSSPSRSPSIVLGALLLLDVERAAAGGGVERRPPEFSVYLQDHDDIGAAREH